MSLYGTKATRPSKMDQAGTESQAMAELYKSFDFNPITTADSPTQAGNNILFQPNSKALPETATSESRCSSRGYHT